MVGMNEVEVASCTSYVLPSRLKKTVKIILGVIIYS